ncbi:MAG: hypothetical protein JSS43_32510 [Proteobacteria bacterium]|nr:hypothetical protein [Pseudomonadota bacterium]
MLRSHLTPVDEAPLLRRLVGQDAVCLALLNEPNSLFLYANDACRRLAGGAVIGQSADVLFPGLSSSIARARHRADSAIIRLTVPVRLPGCRAAALWDVDHVMLPGEDGSANAILLIARPASEADAAERNQQQHAARLADTVAADLRRQVVERTDALARASAELSRRMETHAAQAAELTRGRKLQTLGQLAHAVGHDFFNQLTLVSGNFELLEHRLTNDEALACVRDGYDAAWRAIALARALMGLLRGRALSPQLVDVAALLADAGRLMTEALGDRFQIQIERPGNACPVIAAPDQLLSAVLDLVLAARAVLPDGGAISLGAASTDSTDGTSIAVTVTATAVNRPTIGPYERPDIAGAEAQDALAAVRQFAREAGGALQFGADEANGVTAILLLPRAVVEGVVEEPTGQPDQPALHGDAVLLVVESSPTLRTVIAGLLRGFGYTVLEADSADAAYALAVVTERLDLILCDPSMSHGRTTDLWWQLHAVKPSLPFLLYADGDVADVAFTDIALRKPFNRQQLGGAVLQRLRRRTPETSRNERPGLRIVSDVLRTIRDDWYDRRTGPGLPVPGTFDPTEYGVQDRSFLVRCIPGQEFRFACVGSRLIARAGQMIAGETVFATFDPDIDSALGSLEAAYARCRNSSRPVYEYARFDFGDDVPMLFERLLLPFSADGVAVTDIAGIVLIGESAH